MILELDSVSLDGISEAVRQIHEYLEPAKNHIEEGGVVTVTKSGKTIGKASTVDELLRLVML